MKRVGHLWEQIISDENLGRAIDEVNRTHHWLPGHRPNKCTAWVEITRTMRIAALRTILEKGFVPQKPKIMKKYDSAAQKWRTISEPAQWPDQYVHHALVQVLQPVLMRGMDPNCCGSIRGRGIHYGKRKIERWVRRDRKHSRWCATMDIRHFYDSIAPSLVTAVLERKIKDRRALELVRRVTMNGVQIGAYPSQWLANTVLQGLDHMIRRHKGLRYLRYMDNLTLFGPNKRKLHRLVRAVGAWLQARGLTLKGDWQVFPVDRRLPCALGYRYGRSYTIPRKGNLLRLKRKMAAWRKRQAKGRRTGARNANGLLSRIGQLRHCSNVRLYRMLFRGERVQATLKDAVRRGQSTRLTWEQFMAEYAAGAYAAAARRERRMQT